MNWAASLMSTDQSRFVSPGAAKAKVTEDMFATEFAFSSQPTALKPPPLPSPLSLLLRMTLPPVVLREWKDDGSGGSGGGAFGVGGTKGWLENMGFIGFAGSSVVHVCGGACALAGIIVIGPRHGRFAKDGTPRLIAGHNIALAALGVFILWFGWFGSTPAPPSPAMPASAASP